jgi:hypothetical protein
MITLSDLTLLLLGFLVAWYVIDKKDIALQQPPVASPGMAQEPKPSIAPNQSSLLPDEWKVFQEEMQRFVDEIGLDKEVFIESAPNEMVISLKDTDGRFSVARWASKVAQSLALRSTPSANLPRLLL